MKAIRFDQSLEVLASTVAETLGVDRLIAGTVLRDASGRLAFIAGTEFSDDEEAARLMS